MKSWRKKIPLVGPSLPDLSEKKSDRTTFKLTKETTDDLEWLQNQYRISAKEIFDYLCTEILTEWKDLLSDCIERTSKDGSEKATEFSMRKTYVLSRGAIRILTDISKQNKLSRDRLVSNLIAAYRGKAEIQVGEEYKKQKQIVDLLNKFYAEAKKTEEILQEIIPDTSTLEQFRKILGLTEKLVNKKNL